MVLPRDIHLRQERILDHDQHCLELYNCLPGYLENQGVTVGDLFLFFGWFRQAEIVNERYRFVRKAPDLHVIYGWLPNRKDTSRANCACAAMG